MLSTGKILFTYKAVTIKRKEVSMYQKSLQIAELNEEEQMRLKEIQIYLTIYNICSVFNTVTTAVNFIEYVAEIMDCNVTIINNIVSRAIKKDEAFVPSLNEVHVLLYRSGYPIRAINDITHKGNTRIYTDIKRYTQDPYTIRKRLTYAQHVEVNKLIEGLNKFKRSIIC